MSDSRRFSMSWLGVAAIVLASTIPTAAQDLVGAPRSNQVIEGMVVLPGGGRAGFEVRDGTFLTIENSKEGYFFGFTGTINPATGKPNFVPWKITRQTSGELKLDEIGALPAYNSKDALSLRDIPIGTARKFLLARNTIIRIKGVEEGVFAAPPISGVELSSMPWEELQKIWDELQQDYGVFADGGCCVTCQGATVCASSVNSSCGGCDGGGGGALAK